MRARTSQQPTVKGASFHSSTETVLQQPHEAYKNHHPSKFEQECAFLSISTSMALCETLPRNPSQTGTLQFPTD